MSGETMLEAQWLGGPDQAGRRPVDELAREGAGRAWLSEHAVSGVERTARRAVPTQDTLVGRGQRSRVLGSRADASPTRPYPVPSQRRKTYPRTRMRITTMQPQPPSMDPFFAAWTGNGSATSPPASPGGARVPASEAPQA
jgi:hypothetical protein